MEQQSRGFFVEPTAFCNYTNVVMEHIVFEWDEHKAASNLRKHGVTFVDAVSVFRDPHCLVSQDRFENGEIRWQSIGYASNTPAFADGAYLSKPGRMYGYPHYFRPSCKQSREETL